MKLLKTYELKTYRDGTWKIDSMFDDAELAIDAARRVEEARRYSAVMVVEETYNQDTDRATTRTLFRGGAISRSARSQPPPKAGRPGAVSSPARRGAGKAPMPRGGRAAARGSGSLMPAFALLIIVCLIGLIALYALQQVTHVG